MPNGKRRKVKKMEGNLADNHLPDVNLSAVWFHGEIDADLLFSVKRLRQPFEKNRVRLFRCCQSRSFGSLIIEIVLKKAPSFWPTALATEALVFRLFLGSSRTFMRYSTGALALSPVSASA